MKIGKRAIAVALAAVPLAAGTDPGTTYCTADPFVGAGCVTTLSGAGLPSASSASGFDVTASSTRSLNVGIFFYGFSGPAALPWKGATLCVQPPVKRTLVKFTFGTFQQCDGSITEDFNALNASGLQVPAGTTVNVQAWFRDVTDPAFVSAFSDGYEFTYGP